MAYTYVTKYTSPYSSPRSAFGHSGKPTGITIHHWGLDGQTHDGVVSYLCSSRPANPTSAHYVVSAGKVTCIVDPARAAWHAGNGKGNGSTIGIECRPEMSAGDWATLVELCVELEQVYGSLNYYPHSYWSGTSCPGRYGPQLGRLINEVNAAMAAAKAKPAAKATAKAAPKPAAKAPAIADLDKTVFPGSVRWVVDNGLMTLRSNKTFDPLGKVNRQDLAAILYRAHKKGL